MSNYFVKIWPIDDETRQIPVFCTRTHIFLLSVLRPLFVTPPYSQQIELSSQAVLRCHPPKGEPVAFVGEWRKDGARVDQTTDANFIKSSDGHLLILQARMEDSGNYTCVARNAAGLERTSPPAIVTVFGKQHIV